MRVGPTGSSPRNAPKVQVVEGPVAALEPGRKKPYVVVVSHELGLSGAPIVAVDLATELKASYPDIPSAFVSYTPADPSLVAQLNACGIEPFLLASSKAVVEWIPGDVAILNSIPVSAMLESVFGLLMSRGYPKVLWYLHEDGLETAFKEKDRPFLRRLLATGQLEILIPSIQSCEKARLIFGNDDRVHVQGYRCAPPFERALPSEAFEQKLRLIVSGGLNSGLKGQLPLLYACIEYFDRFHAPDPTLYRDVELFLVGLEAGFWRDQVMEHGTSGLPGRFFGFPKLSREECFEQVLAANVTVCNSLSECLPIFVFEGMFAGHALLRNGASGQIEQLRDGENGYFFDSSDFRNILGALERMGNREKTPSGKLAEMSQTSLDIARKQRSNDYALILGKAKAVLMTFDRA